MNTIAFPAPKLGDRPQPAIAICPTADVPMVATPIDPTWMLGLADRPVTEAAMLARNANGGVAVYLWETTRAHYRWDHASDEVVTVLEGDAFLTDERHGGPERRLGAGDVAFFPVGSRSLWRVPVRLRKVSTLVQPLPAPVAGTLRRLRAAKRVLDLRVQAARSLLDRQPPDCTSARGQDLSRDPQEGSQPQDTHLTFKLVTTREQLVLLRDDWDALWSTAHGDYFTSHASCLLAFDTTHAPLGRKLRCAVARDAGRLVAVLPMVTRRKRWWTIAVTLGPNAAEGCDMVVAEDAPAGIADALLRYVQLHAGADILDLPFVRSGNALDRAILASGAFRVVTQVDTMPYALLRAEASWDDYERSLSRQTQTQTARKRRRLEEAGSIDVETIEGPADAAIAWLLDEKAKWGRKVAKTGQWLFAPAYRAYLQGLAANPGQGQSVLTFVLRVDGKIAAVKVIAVGPRLATLIIAAYDETLSRFSPGNILDEVWVRHVLEQCRGTDGRPPDICFGNGVERYKLHWGRGAGFKTHTYKVAATRWGELPYRAKTARLAAATMLRRLRGSPQPAP